MAATLPGSKMTVATHSLKLSWKFLHEASHSFLDLCDATHVYV